MNNYELIKKLVTATDVVTKYLGNPDKVSGANYFWHSFLRNGDNDPSLCVNSEKNLITDFGDENFQGQDIFNFIVKYYEIVEHKTITNYDALKIIVNDFSLDIDLNEVIISSSKSTSKSSASNYKYMLQATDTKIDKIYTKIDPISFSCKPSSDEIAQIKNRIHTYNADFYTLDELKHLIVTGHTIIPAAIKAENDWLDELNHYQIFLVDIDNTAKVNGEKVSYIFGEEKHITVDKILEYCYSINLVPTFVYNTFSHSESQHRFRLVYVLNQTVDYRNLVKEIYKFLVKTFKDFNIDTAPTSVASLFLGGTKIAFSSDIIYTIVEAEQSVQNILEDNVNTCNEFLRGTSYRVINGKLCSVVGTKDNPKVTSISNFAVYASEKVNYRNGNDVDTRYKVNAILLDNPNIVLPSLIVDKDNYSKFDFVVGSDWDKHCIISARKVKY